MEFSTRILFLCTGNSCRSQMAEAWTREFKGDRLEPCSGGIDPRGVDPRAVKVLAEVGIDITSQQSKGSDAIQDLEFDYVITLCGHPRETCPFFPATTRLLHVGLEDPSKLAARAKDEEEALEHYRRVRDKIRAFVEGMPENLEEN